MGTVVSNNRVGPRLERDVVAIDTGTNSGTINAGDNVYLTASNGAAELSAPSGLTAAIVANIGKYLGVARDTYPIPYSDSLTETVTSPTTGLDVSGLFRFKTHASDSYTPGTPVTIGADAQTVTVATVGPDCSPAGLFVAGTVAGGTLLAKNYVVTAAYITSIGLTVVGTPSAAISATAGQGIIYDFDNAGAFSIPSWALGVAIFLNGVYAYSIMSDATALAADLDITGIDLSNPLPAPTSNALAIGVVANDQTVVGGVIDGTITGATGQEVVVRIQPKA